MIKIRYAELPGGLHARAEAGDQDTVIYLVPGLTAAQRASALRRLRGGARLGQGPPLPAAAVIRASAADSIRVNARSAAAALRLHPVLVGLSLLLFVTVGIAFGLSLQMQGGSAAQAVFPRAKLGHRASSAGPVPAPGIPGMPPGLSGVRPAASGVHQQPRSTPSALPTASLPSPAALPVPVSVPTASAMPAAPVPSAAPTHPPAQISPTSSPSPPAPSPTSAGTGSGGGSGTCILGLICL